MGWLSEHGPQVAIVVAFLAFLRFFTKETMTFFRNHMTKNTKALEHITRASERLAERVEGCPKRDDEGED